MEGSLEDEVGGDADVTVLLPLARPFLVRQVTWIDSWVGQDTAGRVGGVPGYWVRMWGS